MSGAAVRAAASSVSSSTSTSASTSTVFSVVRLSTRAHWRLSAPRVFLEGGLLGRKPATVRPRFIPAKVGRRREYAAWLPVERARWISRAGRDGAMAQGRAGAHVLWCEGAWARGEGARARWREGAMARGRAGERERGISCAGRNGAMAQGRAGAREGAQVRGCAGAHVLWHEGAQARARARRRKGAQAQGRAGARELV